MPVRPLAEIRMPLRMIRPSPMRSASVQPRPLFRPRMAGRVPMGFGSPGFGRGNMMQAGRFPPRRKILVNPHFRGSSSMTMMHGPTAAMSPASAYPKLIREGVPRQPQPQQQPTVNVSIICLTSFITFLLTYFFIHLLPYFFHNRPIPFPGWRS